MRLPPIRRALRTARRMAGIAARGRGVILLYHRVARPKTDPWDLCVSPQNFAAQLKVLKKMGTCRALRDVLPTLGAGYRRAPVFSVTFDDGYADNATIAWPVLVEHGVPATFFVVSGTVGSQAEFWWDALERVFLMPGTLPAKLQLACLDSAREWDMGGAATYTGADFHQNASWRADDDGVPKPRQTIFLEVWQFLAGLPTAQRDALITDILGWAGIDSAARPDYAIMSHEQLARLAGEDSVEIGAHTRSHASLPDIPIESQTEEIGGGKADLEKMLGRQVVSFSYPFGRRTEAIERVVESANFSAACTTRSQAVWPGSESLSLPRVHVKDWDGRTFRKIMMSYL